MSLWPLPKLTAARVYEPGTEVCLINGLLCNKVELPEGTVCVVLKRSKALYFRKDGVARYRYRVSSPAGKFYVGDTAILEATEFATASWNGDVSVTLTVSRNGQMVGTDHASLRVAPFVVHMSTDPTEQVYATDGAGVPALAAFMNDLGAIKIYRRWSVIAHSFMRRFHRQAPDAIGAQSSYPSSLKEKERS